MVLAGSKIGGYLLEERLGGESLDVAVFRATASGGDTAVVKVLIGSGEDAKANFLSMAKPRAGLPAHPNVVRTHRFGVDEATGSPYTVQEFVAGPTFDQRPAEMSLWHRVRCGLEAAQALEHMHSIGVAHGGAIRGKHFRMDATFSVRLVDLGNAYSGGMPPLPEPGQMRHRASEIDVLADVLAYGAVLRVLLDPGIADSVTLRSIVEHCLAESPAKRAANLKVVIERLQAWVDSYPSAQFELKPVATASSLFALPKGTNPQSFFESNWTFSVLALSLAALAGGTVENLSPRTLLTPSGAQAMVPLLTSLRVDADEVSQAEFLPFARQTGRRYSLQNHAEDLPAVGVSAFDAAEYCTWAGKHLPTAAEFAIVTKAKDPRMRHLNDGVAEWIDGRKVPNLFAASRFPALLFPQPKVSEEWRRIHGAPPSLSGWSLAPARYAAADIGFRCVAGAP